MLCEVTQDDVATEGSSDFDKECSDILLRRMTIYCRGLKAGWRLGVRRNEV
jgi:hypothetical protein